MSGRKIVGSGSYFAEFRYHRPKTFSSLVMNGRNIGGFAEFRYHIIDLFLRGYEWEKYRWICQLFCWIYISFSWTYFLEDKNIIIRDKFCLPYQLHALYNYEMRKKRSLDTSKFSWQNEIFKNFYIINMKLYGMQHFHFITGLINVTLN